MNNIINARDEDNQSQHQYAQVDALLHKVPHSNAVALSCKIEGKQGHYVDQAEHNINWRKRKHGRWEAEYGQYSVDDDAAYHRASTAACVLLALTIDTHLEQF